MQGLQNSGIVLAPLAMFTAGDAVCLVMEWIDGMVFGTALFRKTCSDLHAHLNLAIAFSSLLIYLHSARIVHNDLCPFVFFYVPSNKTYPIRLCDMSRSFRFHSTRDRPRIEPPLMRLPYMAPEQTGRLPSAVDLRSDLYSLGAMLFQHLTAVVPIEGAGLLETVHNVLTARPPRYVPTPFFFLFFPPSFFSFCLFLCSRRDVSLPECFVFAARTSWSCMCRSTTHRWWPSCWRSCQTSATWARGACARTSASACSR